MRLSRSLIGPYRRWLVGTSGTGILTSSFTSLSLPPLFISGVIQFTWLLVAVVCLVLLALLSSCLIAFFWFLLSPLSSGVGRAGRSLLARVSPCRQVN